MIGVIVQARMSSTRLPGKTLTMLAGKTVLEHVLHRVDQARIGRTIVATSTDPSDDPIVELADTLGVPTYRGSLTDVLERTANAAHVYDIDPVVRVTADCPLLDPALLRDVARMMRSGRYAYVGVKGSPDGTHAEAFTLAALCLAERLATRAHDREHVVTFMLARPAMFRQGWVRAALDGPSVALDTADDLERIRERLEARMTMHESLVEDPGEDIAEPYEPLDPETVEKAREHGIEFPDWTPTIPRNAA